MSPAFTASIEELRATPIPIDPWKDEQIGENNGGPYKSNYPRIPVADLGEEPLVDVSEYGLVSSDYYLDQFLKGDAYLIRALENGYLWSRALARRLHARLLADADKYLRANGLFLFVASGWRHPDLQRIITSEYASKYGQDQARRMFAPVGEAQAPPPHATGAAFDLEIWSLESGSRLEMYYKHEGRDIYNAYLLEKLATRTGASDDARLQTSLKNRRVLYHILCTRGVVFAANQDLFCGHPGEFWHFGKGDPLSAYLSREPAAQFGVAFPATKQRNS